jgi:hypothetical protein
MNRQSKLLVVEGIVCGPNQACAAKFFDLNMLVRTGGRNRTEEEYRDLLAKGGFDLIRVIRPAGGFPIMEAEPRA